MELQEGPGLGNAALALLQEASLADPHSPIAFSAHATFLYQHGEAVTRRLRDGYATVVRRLRDGYAAVSPLSRPPRPFHPVSLDAPAAHGYMTVTWRLHDVGLDAPAAARLAAYKLLRPTDPAAAQFEAVLRNSSARALQMRATSLNKQVAELRRGGTSPCPYGDRRAAQDATTTAFLQVAAT